MSKVLIAEDDLLMAGMLEDVLVGAHYDVCGIARTVEKAVELIEQHKPDVAILDIRLADGGLGTEIPARLKYPGQMGILYASGHDLSKLTKESGTAVIMKPYRPDDILRAVSIVEQIVETGKVKGSLPAKFIVLK